MVGFCPLLAHKLDHSEGMPSNLCIPGLEGGSDAWDTLVFVIAAAVIVLLNCGSMLISDGAVTEVLMSGDEGSCDAHVRASETQIGTERTEWRFQR